MADRFRVSIDGASGSVELLSFTDPNNAREFAERISDSRDWLNVVEPYLSPLNPAHERAAANASRVVVEGDDSRLSVEYPIRFR